MNIDELCNSFENGNLETLSKSEEYDLLCFSRSLNIEDLAVHPHLRDSINRYSRYMEYAGLKESEREDVQIIGLMIDDFIKNKCDPLTMAAKCKTIDFLMISHLERND